MEKLLLQIIVSSVDGRIKHVGNYESIQQYLFSTSVLRSLRPSSTEEQKFVQKEIADDAKDFLIEAECLNIRHQSWSLLYKYIQSFGFPLFFLYMFLLCVCSTVAFAVSNLYMASWVSETESTHPSNKLQTYAFVGLIG